MPTQDGTTRTFEDASRPRGGFHPRHKDVQSGQEKGGEFDPECCWGYEADSYVASVSVQGAALGFLVYAVVYAVVFN